MFVDFCMHVIVLDIGAWAVNRAIVMELDSSYFLMGNAATGFFVTFTTLVGAIAGINHVRSCCFDCGPCLDLYSTRHGEVELEIRNDGLVRMGLKEMTVIIS
ncbi:hypothetical protein GQ457_01G041130 [Hibiscus cannabinus]